MRQVRRSAGSSSARPTAPRRSIGRPSGAGKVDPAALERAAARVRAGRNGVDHVFGDLHRGVVNDIRELTEVAHRHGALIAVDAVSGLGAVPLPQDEWGVDVVVAGSQKALMAPPGPQLRQRERGGARARGRHPRPALLLRLGAHRAAASARTRRTARSPRRSGSSRRSTWLSGMIESEGLEQVYERHALLGRATREAARALDLELLGGAPDDNANVVTAMVLPDAIDGGSVPKLMRDKFGVTIAGRPGQAEGQDRPHRPLRLLRRLRHHRDGLGARDGAAGARPRGRARRGRGGRSARLLRRGRRDPRVSA